MKHLPACLLGLSLASFACGAGSIDTDGGIPGATLTIVPPMSTLAVTNGAPAQQAFTAVVRFADNTTEDVTTQAAFTVDRPSLGSFAGNLFTAQGQAAGVGLVRANYMGVIGQATVTVNVDNARVVDPASPDAPSWFANATEDPGRAPTLVYPSDQTRVPPNLGDFDVHWVDVGENDLFEVTIGSTHLHLRVYLSGTPNASNWLAYTAGEWAIVRDTHRGESIQVTVRALSSSMPTFAGTGAPITVWLTEQDVEGGLYYWASTSMVGPEGIYRHDMARPGEPAEPFYTRDPSPSGRCVACHALSREGDRMLITYDGGDGPASLVDVATRTETLVTDGTFRWNFAAFEPGGDRFVSVFHGAMTLRRSADGSVVTDVPTPGYSSHPDFSPAGDALVYVQVASATADYQFTGGSIVVQPFDPSAATFGAPTVLVENTGQNNYYPSWSPDGAWILFNRSSEDAYDDASAELWVVPVDGAQAPVRLDTPNVGPGLTNSWGRWAPFAQSLGQPPEPLFWLTFSSKRAFGVRLAAGRPQIWMAPFFPNRARNGQNPSAPAFRLPFQDLGGNNHIAQWTEQVIPIE